MPIKLLALLALGLLASAAMAQVPLAEKKLIEYGWDVPTPAQMRDMLAGMETRPFDGLIFRLDKGFNAFETKPLDPKLFEPDERILRDLKFTRFSHNFVLIWGSPHAEWDWFDDAQWKAVEHNARLLVRVGMAARIKGICFDPEPYDFALWNYAKQPRAKERSFAEYRAQVRLRGKQLMRAFEKEMPGALVLTFFHVSLIGHLADMPEPQRAAELEKGGWGLMPDFLIGMLDGASPKARFIDGNEMAYYYTSREQYFRAYHTMRQRVLQMLPENLRMKYTRQVQAGNALYVDQNFALRQPNTEQYLSFRMTPEERARWFEHNTYWALYTTDEYVWCYSERMNWWKNEVPPGLDQAIRAARQKIREGKPLGYDIEPLIAETGKRAVPGKP
jgi:hypothetical protein